MDQFSGVLGSVASGLGPYAPKVIGALVMVLVAWIGSRLVRTAITRLCQKRQLDEALQSPGFSQMLANVGVGVVWLFTLPGLLETLELKGLLDPVNVMMSRIMGFVPNLVGTIVVFGIGFLVARIVRQITTGMLRAAGSEKMAERMGLATSLGEGGLAGLVGALVFSFIMLPVLAAALEPLGLDAVTKPVSNLLDTVIALIPKVTASTIIIAVAALIGRAVAGIVTGVLGGMGFNKLSQHLGLGTTTRAGARTPSELAGSVVMFSIVIVAVMQACEVLGFAILTKLVVNLGAVLAGVAVAGVVMIGGLWLSNWVAGLIKAGSAANAPALANLVRGAILFFTAALALRQAGLPGDIVGIAFGSVVGAIAVGAAVAVGVGGRHVVGRLLEEAVEALRTTPPDADTPPIQFPD
jgi:hypothetical protein